MTPEQMERYQLFLMEKSGLVFEGRRLRELERAAAVRMIELGLACFDDYYRYLTTRGRGKEELNNLVLSLTVGETQFFRTPDQFAALRKYAIPELVQRRRGESLEMRLLSIGCATGEEPYSLVILLKELLPDFDDWDISVKACDINREFLEAARVGVYSSRKIKLVDPVTRERYFTRQAKNNWRVKDEIKKAVDFVHFNLIDDDYYLLSRGLPFDVILCRNVLIYFNFDTIRSVIDNLYDLIAPEGYLMLGYSETLFRLSEAFQSIHTPEAFFYQKTDSPEVHVSEMRERQKAREREDFLRALGSRPHPLVGGGDLELAVGPDAFSNVVDLRRPGGDGARTRERLWELNELAEAGELEVEYASRREAVPAPEAKVEDKEEVKKPAAVDKALEERLWKEGLEAFSREEFAPARVSFEEILEMDPGSARGNVGMGYILANQAREDEALERAEAAMKRDDLMPELYFLLALIDEKNDEFGLALKNYQRVVMLDPDFAMAHFNLGNLFLRTGKQKDARREFGNVISILERDPENGSLHFSGGLSREALLQFCELQREQLGPKRARGGRGK